MKNRLVLATLYVLSSAFMYAVLTAIVKHNASSIQTPVIVFIQVSVSFLVLLVVMAFSKDRAVIHQNIIESKSKKVHLLRAIFSVGIGYFLFYALKFIPLVDGVLLVNTAPMFVPLIGFIFLKNKINHKLWLPLIIGFIGVAIVLHPNASDFNFDAIYALMSGICMATSMLLLRKAVEYGDKNLTILFYYLGIGTIITGLVSIPFWQHVSSAVYLIIIFSGLLFFIVQYALLMTLNYADAQFSSSLYYSNIIFAAIIAMIFFGDFPTWYTWGGVSLVIIGGISTIQIQRHITITKKSR